MLPSLGTLIFTLDGQTLGLFESTVRWLLRFFGILRIRVELTKQRVRTRSHIMKIVVSECGDTTNCSNQSETMFTSKGILYSLLQISFPAFTCSNMFVFMLHERVTYYWLLLVTIRKCQMQQPSIPLLPEENPNNFYIV